MVIEGTREVNLWRMRLQLLLLNIATIVSLLLLTGLAWLWRHSDAQAITANRNAPSLNGTHTTALAMYEGVLAWSSIDMR